MKVKPQHAINAIQKAETGPFEQGAVGAGKGMICYGMKGGIGSSSRVVRNGYTRYTVGVLTLTNFGKVEECNINEWLLKNGYKESIATPMSKADAEKPDGSVISVVAPDAHCN